MEKLTAGKGKLREHGARKRADARIGSGFCGTAKQLYISCYHDYNCSFFKKLEVLFFCHDALHCVTARHCHTYSWKPGRVLHNGLIVSVSLRSGSACETCRNPPDLA